MLTVICSGETMRTKQTSWDVNNPCRAFIQTPTATAVRVLLSCVATLS